jgi:tRNA(Arg) A34 adenosine deaminase TadA
MGSKINIAEHMPWNTEVYFGFCEDECKDIMRKFFENKRK